MNYIVVLSKKADKSLKKIPKAIFVLFEAWIDLIEEKGLSSVQRINGYRDHKLIGDRKGQRSASLNRSWRVIYTIDEEHSTVWIQVLEINNHDY